MFTLQDISYLHPNKDLLFENISLTVNLHEKVALIGNNGVGKSTLLRIIARDLQPSGGQLEFTSDAYYVPQHFGQYNDWTVAQALRIDDKLHALKEILEGRVTQSNLDTLNDDWTIEERCREALNHWQLQNIVLDQKMSSLSGGEKTKVLLAGISIHQPKLVLMDEPSNHLDKRGRALLYDFLRSSSFTLIVVSHDRKLLNALSTVCELRKTGVKIYGGNYDFYAAQKQIENNALNQDIHNREKALRKAKEKERESIERQQRLDSRGKKKQVKAGVARIMMNTLRNNAENSTSKIKSAHAEKTGGLAQELQDLRSVLPDIDKMKFLFDNSSLHKGKVLFKGTDINFAYNTRPLWEENLDIEIASGERIALHGENGSGKTTLIKIVLGDLTAGKGTVFKAEARAVYIDQDYSLIDNRLNVYEQAQTFNSAALEEHEVKIRLNRFLFSKAEWDKSCSALSGGEKMRLMLCCITMANQSPDILVLDEPTNNLDIQNIEILTAAISAYEGTLLVISHDEYFLQQINISRNIQLRNKVG